jgi:hypothetical protein
MSALETAWRMVASEFDRARATAEEAARAKAAGELNQIGRRLKQYKSESEWCDAALDGAACFTSEAALFTVASGELKLNGSRNMNLEIGSILPFGQAAAFRNAQQTKEPVIALRTKNEVSELLASATPGAHAHIVPILNGTRVAAMLFAATGEAASSNAMELIATLASAVLERNSQMPQHVQISAAGLGHPAQDSDPHGLAEDQSEKLIQTSPAVSAAHPKRVQKTPESPERGALSLEDKLVHVRAQRVARVKVAEMQLYRPEACASGRKQKDLYVFLGQDIDRARELFRNQFMNTRSMVDYLHLELIEKLADNDETLLGADYPGQMD